MAGKPDADGGVPLPAGRIRRIAGAAVAIDHAAKLSAWQRGKAMAIWAMGVMSRRYWGRRWEDGLPKSSAGAGRFTSTCRWHRLVVLAARYVPDSATRPRAWTGWASRRCLGIAALHWCWIAASGRLGSTRQASWSRPSSPHGPSWFFIVLHAHGRHHPLFDLRIFRDRNF